MQYRIVGGNLPAVICELVQGESMVTESGGMAWMSPGLKMETSAGGVGAALKRSLANEHMFQNTYTAENGAGTIAFTSSFPGEIRAFEISPGNGIIVQKSAWLASESTVEMSTFFQKKIGTGVFGGEGFIMSKLSGHGIAFLEISGSVVEYELAEGQQMILSTGYLAAMSETCTMDIQSVSGLKNKFFGGESFFNTVVTGPGKILIQTMPITSVADALRPYFPTSN